MAGATSSPSTTNFSSGARAQGDMQHGAALGGVDRLAREHGVAQALHVRGAGDGGQRLQRLGVQPGLRQVQQQIVQPRSAVSNRFGSSAKRSAMRRPASRSRAASTPFQASATGSRGSAASASAHSTSTGTLRWRRMARIGISSTGPGFSAWRNTRCLSGPENSRRMRRACRIALSVSEIRGSAAPGARIGVSSASPSGSSASASRSPPGNSEAVCPSRPMPSTTTSKGRASLRTAASALAQPASGVASPV
jgi:hypothetical protein